MISMLRFKNSKRFFPLCTLLFLPAFSFAATPHLFRDVFSPPWETTHHITADHMIDACATVYTLNPYRIMLGASPAGLELWMANEEWRLRLNRSVRLEISSGDYQLKGIAAYKGPTKLAFPLSEKNLNDLLQTFQKEKRFTITLNSKIHVPVSLAKGHKALRSFKRCTRESAFAHLEK